jgi:hypothetical protein
MARNLEHLELPLVSGSLPRRLKGGARPPKRDSKAEHGTLLLGQADQVVAQHLVSPRPQGISPALVFRLKIHKGADLDDEQIRRLGLSIVSKEKDKTIVAFSSDEALAQFKRYLTEYAGLTPEAHAYDFVAAIDCIVPLSPDDRIGRLLRAQPLSANEVAPLDIELMHPGTVQGSQRYLDELRRVAERHGGRVSDSYVGDYLCLARCHLPQAGVDAFLSIDYVMEVDRVPRPTFETSLIFQTTLDDIGEVPEVSPNAPGILVIDSGVMGNHPLIRPALGDAQVFPDLMGQRVRGGPEDGDEQSGGHGTGVCGIAIYGDLGECIESRSFVPQVRLFSARVLDDNCQYDEENLVEHQIQDAVDYFVGNYPQCRVINLSLGDARLFARDGQKQFRLAAKIDELIHKLRGRNVVIVVSAGNYRYRPESADLKVTDYPGYLLHDDARVCDPGTAALALTVGSVASGNIPYRFQSDAGRRCVAGQKEFPSPFTRSGYGIDGMVKPDVVELGGDDVFDRAGGGRDPGAGVPMTARDFAPPTGSLFRTDAGTSFATPAVAHLAARLFDRFPSASSNLIRALIADSARIPAERPEGMKGSPWDEKPLRVYGYGRPSYERAAFSDQNEVLLLAENEVPLDHYHLYTIPALPDEFFETRGSRYLSVTLAHDPPTREGTRTLASPWSSIFSGT